MYRDYCSRLRLPISRLGSCLFILSDDGRRVNDGEDGRVCQIHWFSQEEVLLTVSFFIAGANGLM